MRLTTTPPTHPPTTTRSGVGGCIRTPSPPFSMLPGKLRRVVDDARHVAILRRLVDLSPIGLPVQLRALADGFEYERANRPTVLPAGGRIPEWFVSAVDQLVAAKLVEPAESMWTFGGTPSSTTGAAARAFRITDAGRREVERR
jgi:hypothetical protein